jgi:hypothetical protein
VHAVELADVAGLGAGVTVTIGGDLLQRLN